MKTSRFTSTALLSSLLTIVAFLTCNILLAQEADSTVIVPQSQNGIIIAGDTIIVTDSLNSKAQKFIADATAEPELTFFQGFTLSADVIGPVMYLASDYGSFEGALRLNLKNTYFPIVEVGYAKCDATNENTDIVYKTSAPYLRIGCDMNMLKNKFQDNRLYVGLRYGFSKFNYDLSGPDLVDPIWGGQSQFNYTGLSSSSSWIEFLVGVQVKIWKTFHMGWSVRLKRAFSTKSTDYSDPYYIPGYGTTTSSTAIGATYNLIFDLNWGKKHSTSIKVNNEKTQTK